ncbi:ABC transporter substrate-binding protein [Paraburkholderia mimosarum]|uniref:ABC transporter substrate-binding protein n=1 Tax=Paraburkholderia mimosarum TaxID=312026 RepID=UPI0003FC2494|nr:extracellular solute-binding protein [Paraburkholderia mimosarum]
MSKSTKRIFKCSLLVAALAFAGHALAADYTISVVAGGSGPNDTYRTDAIEMAADVLMKQAAAKGEHLKITVDKRSYSDWDSFKQAVTLSAESGKAPNIVVTGHEDIAPWSQSGIIVPVDDYLDTSAPSIKGIYPNLLKVASYNGKLYGVPQDAEARTMFMWKGSLRAIGYSDKQIDALPGRIKSGEYTLYDMLADAKKAQDKGLVAPGYGFYPRPTAGPDYWQYYVSFGGQMQNPKTGKLVFDKQAIRKTYQFFADAVKMGVTRKDMIGTPWDQWYHEVASGKAMFWQGGTWHYARYTGKEGLKDFFSNVDYAMIPAGDRTGKANTLTHPLVYLITKQGSDKQNAIEARLIEIASEPRINALHALKSSHLGISPAEKNVEAYRADRWSTEATERLMPYAYAMPNDSDLGNLWNVYWKGLEAAWTGSKSPEEAAADAEKEVRASSFASKVEVR